MAIAANELRIGNLVYSKLTNKNEEANLLCIEYSHDYEPIPLTEEWLLKFGFEKLYGSEFYWENKEWSEFYFLAGELGFEYNSHRIATVKYVHQLQNLYFALTGEELTMKT